MVFLYLMLQLSIGCRPEHKYQNLYPLETAQKRWQSEVHRSAGITEADFSRFGSVKHITLLFSFSGEMNLGSWNHMKNPALTLTEWQVLHEK